MAGEFRLDSVERLVDYEVHSNRSDGEHPPPELVRKASHLGLHTLSITDHNTLSHIQKAMFLEMQKTCPGKLRRVNSLDTETGLPIASDDLTSGLPLYVFSQKKNTGRGVYVQRMFIVPGVEIATKYPGRCGEFDVDILAYMVPSKDAKLGRWFKAQVDPRYQRAMEVVTNLAQRNGWPRDELVAKILNGQGPAQQLMMPHIAKAILYLRDQDILTDVPSDLSIPTAMDVYGLRKKHQAMGVYVDLEAELPSTPDIVAHLVSIGAIPVLQFAEVPEGEGGLKAVFEKVMDWSNGMAGLQARCPTLSTRKQEELRRVAEECGVELQIAGSNYHALKYDGENRKTLGVAVPNMHPKLNARLTLERLINRHKELT